MASLQETPISRACKYAPGSTYGQLTELMNYVRKNPRFTYTHKLGAGHLYREITPKSHSPLLTSLLASCAQSLAAYSTTLQGYSADASNLTGTKHHLPDPNSQPTGLKTAPCLTALHFLVNVKRFQTFTLL